MNSFVCDTDPIEFVSTWELVVMLRRCQHHLEVTMDQALQGMGMSFAQYRALEALASNNAMHISWLARMLRLSRQTAQGHRPPARETGPRRDGRLRATK